MTLKFCDKTKTPCTQMQIHVFLKTRIAFLCFSLLSTGKWHFQVPKKAGFRKWSPEQSFLIMTHVITHMPSSGTY